MPPFDWPKEPRHLDITDLERIERYRRAGYGGCVSDSLQQPGRHATPSSSPLQAAAPGHAAGRAARSRSSCTRWCRSSRPTRSAQRRTRSGRPRAATRRSG